MSTRVIEFSEYPALLKEIPDPPEKLYHTGAPIPPDNSLIAVVGSRKYTEYGKRAAESIIRGLRGYSVTVVSGLALGIDAIAHRAALKNGIHTIAVPGSGLDPQHIYPHSHRGLAEEILKHGGTLFSELEPKAKIYPSNFPARNRIMAGMSHAVLIVEAAPKSGTLITARLAMEYNRDVFAVPGSIFSNVSEGTNALIRDGASPALSADDIIEELHLKKSEEGDTKSDDSSKESTLPFEDSISRDAFFEQFEDTATAQKTLSKLELEGRVAVRGNRIYKK